MKNIFYSCLKLKHYLSIKIPWIILNPLKSSNLRRSYLRPSPQELFIIFLLINHPFYIQSQAFLLTDYSDIT